MPEEQLYIINLDELLDILARRAPAEFHNATIEIMKDASAWVQYWVKINSPVDTNRMRSSWRFEVQDAFGEVQGIIGTNVANYPQALENSNKKPRSVGRIPFLRPAVEEHQSEIKQLFDRGFQAVIKRLGM